MTLLLQVCKGNLEGDRNKIRPKMEKHLQQRSVQGYDNASFFLCFGADFSSLQLMHDSTRGIAAREEAQPSRYS